MKALIFDLNGTMVNDMEYHTMAWQHIMNNDLGGNFTYEQVKSQMYGKNAEVLVRMFGSQRFSEKEMDEISIAKEKRYQQAYLPQLSLINGLHSFIEKAYQLKVPMAIASAAIMFNIDFVLDNLHINKYFSAIVSAEDVQVSKPHPETFLKAAQLLNIQPADCLVFEDTPKGVECAANAGMNAIVLTTTHQKDEFSAYPNILHFCNDYSDSYITSLL